jgi:hypothetical protein
MKVADQLWIAVASLQREKGLNADFSVKEIMERAKQIDPKGASRPGLRVHVSKHCVAGKPPDPGNYRMLHETGRGRRRLYREGDPSHPGRRQGKSFPFPQDIPERFRDLLDWYKKVNAPVSHNRTADPVGATAETLMELFGIMNEQDAEEMSRIIEEGCEQIEANEW